MLLYSGNTTTVQYNSSEVGFLNSVYLYIYKYTYLYLNIFADVGLNYSIKISVTNVQ